MEIGTGVVLGAIGGSVLTYITQGGKDVCGPETSFQNGKCVVSNMTELVRCGPGTTLQHGECVALGEEFCGPGTTLQDGKCVALGEAFCGRATIFQDGKCVGDKGVGESHCRPGTNWNDSRKSSKDAFMCRVSPDVCGLGTKYVGNDRDSSNSGDTDRPRCILDVPSTMCGPGTYLDTSSNRCEVVQSSYLKMQYKGNTDSLCEGNVKIDTVEECKTAGQALLIPGANKLTNTGIDATVRPAGCYTDYRGGGVWFNNGTGGPLGVGDRNWGSICKKA